jgi:hypothetical protein
MRVEELRNVIRDVGGILPALQRLSYAGTACSTASTDSALRQLGDPCETQPRRP